MQVDCPENYAYNDTTVDWHVGVFMEISMLLYALVRTKFNIDISKIFEEKK